MMAEQGPSVNDILSQYALKETDLRIKCPREVRNEIAIKLDDWKMIGYYLGFPKEKLTSIGRENETQDLCKVTLLDFWSKREGEGASYLKLADALYRRQRRDLVELLCKLLIASRLGAKIGKYWQTTSSSTVEGAVAVRSRARTPGLEETFMCPCGGCSLMVYLKNGCPKSRIPYLGMPVNLSVGDKRNLKYALNKDTRKLCESFRDLSDSTCESLITRDIKLDRLIRVAKNHDKSLQLSSVKSVDEAFTVLAESMSFFNHKLLANIIEKLGDASDKRRLVKYSEEFNLYCKRKIFEVDPGTWEGSERFPEAPKGRQLFAVVVSDLMVETLGETELVLEILADVMDIQPAALHIHRIDKGSVMLVFSVPNCIADEIFPLPQEKISLLKARGIMVFLPSISKAQNHKDPTNVSAPLTVTVPIPEMPCSLPSSYSSQSGFFDPSAASCVPKSVIPHSVPSSYYLLTHQSGFSSSTSMAEPNDLHDMSMEEIKRECQHLRDENRELKLRLHGVNEFPRLLQDRSELVQVLEEKNRRLEIALMRIENRCANYDRMLKSQKGVDLSTAKSGQSSFIPGPSRQILEAIMKENVDLKKIIMSGNLTGKIDQKAVNLQRRLGHVRSFSTGSFYKY